MARPIVLSNGQMHIGINHYGLVHDFYYPYVGGENHAAAADKRHKVGVYVDGNLSWLDDESWTFSMTYGDNSLIGHTTASNPSLQVVLEFTDVIAHDSASFVRSVHVVNGADHEREIKLFMHQVFAISESKRSDTIQYLPDSHGLLHYKGRRYFIAGGASRTKKFDQYAIGLHGIEGKESVYKDAEDGILSGNSVEHGSVDSILGFYLTIGAHNSAHADYWVVAGRTIQEAVKLHNDLRSNGVSSVFVQTAQSWHNWLQIARPSIEKVDTDFRRHMTNSILLVKSHIDDRGGVVASTDTTMLNYSRDSYAYCWPRDMGYALWPLLRMGYKEELEKFFAFSKRTMDPRGFVMHKYAPDGAIGSSWHPYTTYNGKTIPPIQEDETAIIVFLFGRYYAMHQKSDIIEQYYSSMIKPMADFMAGFIDPNTNLPYPTYDLWERLFLTTTYTTALVYAALMEAVALAEAQELHDDAVRWREAADSIYENRELFYDKESGSFIKGFLRDDNQIIKDNTIDMSSAYGAYMFGLYAVDSPEITSSFRVAADALTTNQSHPAKARFANDEYYRFDSSRVGNPWHVTTLWYAQYLFEIDKVDEALEIINWVQSRMMNTGVLPEQFDPDTLNAVSVAPLTWSQAEFVNCLLDSIHHGD